MALYFGLPWIFIMLIFSSITNEVFTYRVVLKTVVAGIFFGVSFALIMEYLANRLYKKTVIKINDDERLIKEGGANHFKGKDGVGGKLALTDKRLIFKSHNSNVQNREQTIDFARIKTFRETKTLNFFKNGLTIELINHDIHKFIVDDPGDWVKEIEKQKRS